MHILLICARMQNRTRVRNLILQYSTQKEMTRWKRVLYDHCFHSTTAFYVATCYLELEVYSMKSRLGGGQNAREF